MPGEPEGRRETERRQRGVPLTPEVLASLGAEAAGLGMALPEVSPTPLAGTV